jgi:hypothetical protein
MDGGEPDPKKQRVGEQYKRVTRDTFVEAMLVSISTTLASDSEYGYNSANRIRQRVEDITSRINDQSDDPNRSSSRAVLESRFALGADDSQYLAQAVSMLWAGDGGEKLRIAPLASMPEIMRVASAKGMLGAMKDVVKDRKALSTGSIQRGLDLTSWLMQVEDVRGAVINLLKNGEMGDIAKKIGTELETEFSKSTGGGMEAIRKLHSSGRNGHARSLCVAILMLVDTSSLPATVVDTLVRAMREVVQTTESDSAKVFNAALALNGTYGRVIGTPNLAGWEKYTSSATGANPALGKNLDKCFDFDPQTGVPNDDKDDFEEPTFFEFATSLDEAARRISNNQMTYAATTSNVYPNDADSDDASKQWRPNGILSPLWKSDAKEKWLEVLGLGAGAQGRAMSVNEYVAAQTAAAAAPAPAPAADPAAVAVPPAAPPPAAAPAAAPAASSARATNQQVSAVLKAVTEEHNRNRVDFDGTIASFSTSMLDGSVDVDDAFVQFCMIRGLCGFQGPHQAPPSMDLNFLPYDYPSVNVAEYKMGEYFNESEQSLDRGFKQSASATEKLLYDASGMQLDTDFFGNATQSMRVPRYTYYDEQGSVMDQARRALWMPTKGHLDKDEDRVSYDMYSQSICEASVYEFMAKSLKNPSMPPTPRSKNLMDAAAAVAKLRQLEAMAYVKFRDPGNIMYEPDKMGGHVYITRPCRTCPVNGMPYSHKRVAVPVDCGIADFSPTVDGPAPLKIDPLDYDSAFAQRFTHPMYSSKQIGNAGVAHDLLSEALTHGMRFGWKAPPTGNVRQDPSVALNPEGGHFTLFIDAAADGEPVDANANLTSYQRDGQTRKMLPADVNMQSMFNVLAKAIKDIDALEQLNCEESYVERISQDDSVEMGEVFGLYRNIEDSSRDRRADIWTDAIREVAISGDRLFRFVTTLTGAIGEAADSAISWEDEDLKAMAKEAATRQKAMAERVSRFQTKLVESVVSSTLRASKLQLDVRERANAGNELVVLNSDVKDSIRQITSGEAGHGFFEASVELNTLMGNAARPITIKDLVGRLRMVSEEFQEQIQQSMAVSTPVSYTRIAEPRNSFMMHLKPDTSAAIQKAFDLISSELRMCSGYHRHVHLWEFIEGKDWVLTTRFAELVGLMLQNTRMRSGSFAAYVGTPQIITNTQNVRMQIQRLKTQACHYLTDVVDPPLFLSPYGRTMYFGGTMHATAEDLSRSALRIQRKKDAPSFGGDGRLDYTDYWGQYRGSKPFAAQDVLMRRIKELTRKVNQGSMAQDRFVLTNGERLNMFMNPSKQRRVFGTSSYGNVVETLYAELVKQMNAFSNGDPVGLLPAIVRDQHTTSVSKPSGPKDFCEKRFSESAENGWLVALCKQIRESTMRFVVKERKSNETGAFNYPTAEVRQELAGKKYYVIECEVTREMLDKNVAFKGLAVDQAHKNETVQKQVDRVLHILFNIPERRNGSFRPHPNWLKGETAFANKWIRIAWPRQDARDKQATDKVSGLRKLIHNALGCASNARHAYPIMFGIASLLLVNKGMSASGASAAIGKAATPLIKNAYVQVETQFPTLVAAGEHATDYASEIVNWASEFMKTVFGKEVEARSLEMEAKARLKANNARKAAIQEQDPDWVSTPVAAENMRVLELESEFLERFIPSVQEYRVALEENNGPAIRRFEARQDLQKFRKNSITVEAMRKTYGNSTELIDPYTKMADAVKQACEGAAAGAQCFASLPVDQQAKVLDKSQLPKELADQASKRLKREVAAGNKAIAVDGEKNLEDATYQDTRQETILPFDSLSTITTGSKETIVETMKDLLGRIDDYRLPEVVGASETPTGDQSKQVYAFLLQVMNHELIKVVQNKEELQSIYSGLKGEFQETEYPASVEILTSFIQRLGSAVGIGPATQAQAYVGYGQGFSETDDIVQTARAFFQLSAANKLNFETVVTPYLWNLLQLKHSETQSLRDWLQDPENFDEAVRLLDEQPAAFRSSQDRDATSSTFAEEGVAILRDAQNDGTGESMVRFIMHVFKNVNSAAAQQWKEGAEAAAYREQYPFLFESPLYFLTREDAVATARQYGMSQEEFDRFVQAVPLGQYTGGVGVPIVDLPDAYDPESMPPPLEGDDSVFRANNCEGCVALS